MTNLCVLSIYLITIICFRMFFFVYVSFIISVNHNKIYEIMSSVLKNRLGFTFLSQGSSFVEYFSNSLIFFFIKWRYVTKQNSRFGAHLFSPYLSA